MANDWTDQEVGEMVTVVVQDILEPDVEYLTVSEAVWDYLPEFADDNYFIQEVFEAAIAELTRIKDSWETGEI